MLRVGVFFGLISKDWCNNFFALSKLLLIAAIVDSKEIESRWLGSILNILSAEWPALKTISIHFLVLFVIYFVNVKLWWYYGFLELLDHI